MKHIIRKILLEELSTDSFELVYTFDDFGVGKSKDGGNVYFNGAKRIEGQLTDDTETITLKSGGDEYEFYLQPPEISFTSKQKPYVSVNTFREAYPEAYDEHVAEKVEALYKPQVNVLVNDTDVIEDPLDKSIQTKLRKKENGIPDLILTLLEREFKSNWGKIDDGDCQTDYGVLDIFPAVQGERWSILNFFDTNPRVYKVLTQEYIKTGNDFTLENFKSWLDNNSNFLFGKNSQLLNKMVKENLTSFNSGSKTEDVAVQHLINMYGIPEEDITAFCLGSIEDRENSRDIKIKMGSRDVYLQVKPLIRFSEHTNKKGKTRYMVYTNNMRYWYKWKPIDYIAYVANNNMYLFPNKGYKVSKNGVMVHHFLPPVETLEQQDN